MKSLIRSQTPKVLNGTVEIRKWISSSHVVYNGCNYSSMSGLRKSMLVKPSLFVLAEVSTDRKQLGRRLPSGYQQEVSNLSSTSSNTPPHVRRNDRTHQNWKYKPVQRPFLVRKKLAIWPQVSRAGARWPQVHFQPAFVHRVLYE